MPTLEAIAQKARDLITSDDESVWLDLPQIIYVVRPALSLFFESALRDERTRAMFPVERRDFTVTQGTVDISGLTQAAVSILDQVEIFLEGWSYPVRMCETKERLANGGVTDALHLHAYREGTILIFSTDTVGAFGGGTINNIDGQIVGPKVTLDVANLPELLEGKFVSFLANYVKDQILKRP